MLLTPALPVGGARAVPPSFVCEHRDFACHAVAGRLLAVAADDGLPAPERIAAGECGWLLVAADLPTLRERIDLLTRARSQLEATRDALERHDLDRARAGLHALAPQAPALRTLLIDAYQHAPRVACVQIALGIVGLADGRHGEGLFHLLRATPGQIEWFAVCRRYHLFRPSPAACRQLLATATAAELVGRHDEADVLQKTLRMAVRMLKLAALCERLDGDLLWTRPDVLVHVRGVIEVGTPAATAAVLPTLAIHRVLAFAATPQQHAELVAADPSTSAAATRWTVVPPTAAGTTHAVDLDGWLSTTSHRASDCNLLRIGDGMPAHTILRSALSTLRHVDFVVVAEPAATADEQPVTKPRQPDESTVAGLLAAHGFVDIAATENGRQPRQVLYTRPEHV